MRAAAVAIGALSARVAAGEVLTLRAHPPATIRIVATGRC
jgi:hypothetical protein